MLCCGHYPLRFDRVVCHVVAIIHCGLTELCVMLWLLSTEVSQSSMSCCGHYTLRFDRVACNVVAIIH